MVVHSAAEHHNVIQPRINADDAKADGCVAHHDRCGRQRAAAWLAEAGEGNSEATSANMNEVSYRHYYSRQQFVARRIEHLCRYAYQRAAALGAAKPLLDPEIRASASDISREDNQKLAAAARDVASAFALMMQHGLDRDRSIARLIYRFAGEDLDEAELADIVARGTERRAESTAHS